MNGECCEECQKPFKWYRQKYTIFADGRIKALCRIHYNGAMLARELAARVKASASPRILGGAADE